MCCSLQKQIKNKKNNEQKCAIQVLDKYYTNWRNYEDEQLNECRLMQKYLSIYDLLVC